MDIQTKLKAEYPDLIASKTLVVPVGSETFDIIHFDSFIERKFPYQNKFIQADIISVLRKKLYTKYGNDNTCFKSFGTTENVSIESLKFYQPEVGINGPRHSEIDEPVSILKYGNTLLLYNGYHRTLMKILNNEIEVKSYIITFEE